MLLVASATRLERANGGADDLLHRLAALLPDAWIVAGAVAAKPISDSCRRGHTRPFDAIVIGERMIFVLDIWSHSGPMTNRQKLDLFARVHDTADFSDGFWQSFRRETEKLKALLQERFEVEPGRVIPERIWPRSETAAVETGDLRSFARAATRLDKSANFAPLHNRTVDRIASFLAEEASAAPKPAGSGPVVVFADESATPGPAARSAPRSATPAMSAARKETLRTAAPKVDAPKAAEASKATARAPAQPPPSTPVWQPPTAAIARPELESRPAPAARAAPLPLGAATAPAARGRDADTAREQAAASASPAPGWWRATAHWQWAASLVLLLVVAQAGAIAWLTLPGDAPKQVERAPPAAPPPAPAAPPPAPFVVRSLATSEPMQVGGEAVTLRAGPSPEFAAVGELDAGTDVVASASATGPGGSAWVEVSDAKGAIGFVPDAKVKAEPAAAVASERVVPPAPAPAPAVERAEAPQRTARPKRERAVRLAQRSRPKMAAVSPGVACILPGGEEVQASRSACRAQAGIIYQ